MYCSIVSKNMRFQFLFSCITQPLSSNHFYISKLNFPIAAFSLFNSVSRQTDQMYWQMKILLTRDSTYVIWVVLNSQCCMVNRISPDPNCNRWIPYHRDTVFPSFCHRYRKREIEKPPNISIQFNLKIPIEINMCAQVSMHTHTHTRHRTYSSGTWKYVKMWYELKKNQQQHTSSW